MHFPKFENYYQLVEHTALTENLINILEKDKVQRVYTDTRGFILDVNPEGLRW